nr:hypothetical protein [Gemmatimonadota bacterium]
MNRSKSKTFQGAAALAVASFVAFTGGAGGVAAQEQEPPQEPPPQQEAVPAIQPVRVDAVEVRGNERLSDDVILSTAGILLGDLITFRDVQQAIRRLWITDQYADVKVYAEEVDPADPVSPVRLIVEVEEQPYVAYVDFRGLEHIRARTVRDTAGLRAGQAYDPARAAEAESLVRELLAEKGIRLRSIEHRLEPIAGVEGEYRLVFDVEEGTRVAVAEIVIEGNEVFDDGQIEDAMGTKEEGFFWFR